MPEPEIIKFDVLDTQVCVPKEWADEQVVDFANLHNPSGLTHGWQILKSMAANR